MNGLFNYPNLESSQMFLKSYLKSFENLEKGVVKAAKTVKSFMFVMLLAISTIANAGVTSTVPSVTFEQVGTQKVRLNLTNLKNELPQLSIIDTEETILHSESIRQSIDYTKAYDFSTLQDGTYTIKLELQDRIVSQNAIVTNQKVALGTYETMPKPVFKVFDNAFDVSVTGIAGADVSIEIFDEADNTVHQQFDENVNGIKRQYIMSNLPNGTYIVKVNIGKTTHYKTLTF